MPSGWKRDPATTDKSGFGWLIEELRQHKQMIHDLQTRAAINNATMTGLLKVLGSVLVSGGGGITIADDGTLTVDGNVVVGGTADFSGDTTIGGNLAVTGTLALPAGIIGNEALTSPVRGDVMRATAGGFALSTSYTTVASQTWQVPDGFSQVAVSVVGKVFAYNPTAGLDYVYGRPNLVRVSDGAQITGVATPTAVSGSNGSGTSIAPGVAVFGFPPGDSLRLEVQAQTAFGAWSANTGNTAEIAGSLTWYR